MPFRNFEKDIRDAVKMFSGIEEEEQRDFLTLQFIRDIVADAKLDLQDENNKLKNMLSKIENVSRNRAVLQQGNSDTFNNFKKKLESLQNIKDNGYKALGALKSQEHYVGGTRMGGSGLKKAGR